LASLWLVSCLQNFKFRKFRKNRKKLIEIKEK
jgi:hypothetical protein